jgi:signal transduction histidine kinase/ligand-binding sensor domain-containing protein/CheY-like chemotaxis protein/AraC-like DNA-binding protein
MGNKRYMMRAGGLWILCFFLLPGSLLAIDPPVRTIGIENGLSNNAVTGVYQDYRGFMWFTTYDGLNKYDGNTFTVFRNRIGDSTSLRGNEVYTISGDAAHNLWIGGRNGISIYHPESNLFSAARYLDPTDHHLHIVSAAVSNIITSPGGDILAATEQPGLLVFENGSAIGHPIALYDGESAIRSYSVSGVKVNKQDGSVWLFVPNYGLCRFANGKVQVINRMSRQGNCLEPDGMGGLWLGNDNGLYRYDIARDQWSENVVDGNFKISNLCMDGAGVLWIASDGKGVWWKGAQEAKARPFLSSEGKPLVNSSAVYSICVDKQGRKWIGTLRGGINIVEARPNPIRAIVYKGEKASSPNDNYILSFCEDPDHNVWIGTDGGGLRYWRRSANTYTVYTHDAADSRSVGGNFITGVLCDQRGDIWVSAWYGGISRLNKPGGGFQHYACYNPNTNMEENRVWLLYEDGSKHLWASTSNDGTLYMLNRETNRFEVFDKSIVNIQCLAEDRHGEFWGGNYSSLIRIDREGRQHRRYELGYTVRCIHEDRAGNFWIGTQGGGLLLFDRRKGSWRRFADADGLHSNTILRILEDSKGNLWMSTFNGLIRMDAGSGKFRNFSLSDGLQSNQFSFNAAVALHSGEFLFGGIKGFNLFYPDSVYERAQAPDIFLTGIRMADKAVEANSPFVSGRTLEDIHELTVPYDRTSLAFDFVGLEYGAPDKIQYAYYLEGWDNHWNYSNTVKTANYTRLREGVYHFKIRSTDVSGLWGAEKELLSIVVLPPWYRTWWAYLIYVLMLVGAGGLYLRYTKQQERLRYEIKLAHLENEKDKELHEKKLQFFTNISHEFRTPLTLIINPLKEVLQHGEKTGMDKELIPAYRNARRLLSLVDQLLLFRKADSGSDSLKVTLLNIVEVGNEVFQCFAQQAKAKHIDYRYPGGDVPVWIYGDWEKIEIALFNLLSNAFKFTPDGGSISLSIKEEGERSVVIQVEDSGCGIAETDSGRIFEKYQQADPPGVGQSVAGGTPKTGFGIGLYLVKHFIEQHKGVVHCYSKVGEGTRFTIVLKKDGTEPPLVTLRPEENPGLLEELAEVDDLPAAEEYLTAPMDGGKMAEEVVTGKKSLLLIDDDADIRAYLEHIFADKYLLYSADNGNDGFLLAQQHVPDLIISDINMRGMDGVELCGKIKRSEALGHIPVILLTGATAADTRLKGVEGGAEDYITKPFDKDLLQARVESILRNRNLLQRYFFDNITLRETAVKVPAEYQNFLRKCIEVIESNIDSEDFSTPKFAKAMGMSRSALYQKVKSISGQSLNAFIRSIRLRRAAVLMLTANMNVNQAAFQVGIGDARYFREQFVKVFGMTPSEYIKKYRPSFNRDFNVIRGE